MNLVGARCRLSPSPRQTGQGRGEGSFSVFCLHWLLAIGYWLLDVECFMERAGVRGLILSGSSLLPVHGEAATRLMRRDRILPMVAS
jgi:hypothetical protein